MSELGRRCFAIGKGCVPVEGLTLQVQKGLLRYLEIVIVPEIEMGLQMDRIIVRASCEARQFLDVDVVAIPWRLPELAEHFVCVQQVGQDADEHDSPLLLPQEKPGLHLAGFPSSF